MLGQVGGSVGVRAIALHVACGCWALGEPELPGIQLLPHRHHSMLVVCAVPATTQRQSMRFSLLLKCRSKYAQHTAPCGVMLLQGAVAGDVDGDGLLEIVFGTLDGRVHAIRGTDGSPIPNFPFQTGFRVQAQPTIAPLDPQNPNVQHILVMSFDGFLYAINGKSGCAHAVDIGENSYSSVLVDDLCGDGNLELLVSTMNGNVYMLQTQAPYHPLKTWSSQVGGGTGAAEWAVDSGCSKVWWAAAFALRVD